MGLVMKVTVENIVRLWFAADTPIRQYKIVMNPMVWEACLRVSKGFTPPSGALNQEQYRKSDKMAFARAVLEEIQTKKLSGEAVYEWA